MSAALNTRADTSIQSVGTLPDLSLGSFVSGFSTPARNLRVPSATSHTTAQSSAALATPSPPDQPRRKQDDVGSALKRMGHTSHEEVEQVDGDLLDTPGRERPWGEGPDTPLTSRAKRSRASVGGTKGVTLTLRDQEKHIDNLKKENFNIKLRVHFLEERLAQLAPDQIDAALKQNINLKIEVQQRGMELKKLKKLLLELERELERSQRAGGSRERERELEQRLQEREKELREFRRGHISEADDAALEEAEARNAELEEELENIRGSREREQELEETLQERERELRELRRGHVSDAGDAALQEAESRNAELEEELENIRGLLEENMDEIERLREIVERKGDGSMADDGEDRRERMKRRMKELEAHNEELMDVMEGRDAVEDNINALRDKLAASQIEIQQKEDEIEIKSREIEDLMAEHDQIVEVVEQEWRGEVEEARGQVEELRDVLAERETESKELRLNISELEANTNDLHTKFEATLAHLEQEAEEKDAEIRAANSEIEKFSEQVYMLEDENDKLKEESDHIREEEAVERERLEALCTALKEKVSGLKLQLGDLQDMYDQCCQDIHAHRSRQEELAQHVEDLVEEVQREREARERLEIEMEKAEQDRDVEIRRERRALEAKESALQSALNDLARKESLLAQREADMEQVQNALQSVEVESKKLGESHTTARFSLQLEADRLKRDIERLEDELSRARKGIDERESKTRDRDGTIDKLHAEKRDLESQLAAQHQARLNVSEKLDGVQGSLKVAESDLATARSKVSDLEQRLSKDQRSLLAAETQYRDQLTERNTLLLTIYQYMDKILGVDKTPKKGIQAETKPFTNFSVFHDNLITRLKALSQIQLDFDKRCKEAEARFTEKLTDMRKQLDNRWKQIDKFESSVKAYGEAKATWRRKYTAKESELEALKTTSTELNALLNSSRRPQQGDSSEVKSALARATNAEKRLVVVQNQLLHAEEKISSMNQKTVTVDSKWEVRVKEYEARIKAAEEKYKRERQGGKERVLDLENQIKSLERQNELAAKRSNQLESVAENNKIATGRSPTR